MEKMRLWWIRLWSLLVIRKIMALEKKVEIYGVRHGVSVKLRKEKIWKQLKDGLMKRFLASTNKDIGLALQGCNQVGPD